MQTALLLLTLGSLYVPVGTFLPQKRADLVIKEVQTGGHVHVQASNFAC